MRGNLFWVEFIILISTFCLMKTSQNTLPNSKNRKRRLFLHFIIEKVILRTYENESNKVSYPQEQLLLRWRLWSLKSPELCASFCWPRIDDRHWTRTAPFYSIFSATCFWQLTARSLVNARPAYMREVVFFKNIYHQIL
jgi:hypothetical protein